MNKNALLTLIAIVGLVIVGILVFGGNDKVMAPTQSQEQMNNAENNQPQNEKVDQNQSYEVTYTDSGYSPASLTIPVGAIVIFKNESSMNMWLASAPHPTHTIYPEFDAKTGIGKDQTYEFTFTKQGTWRYHDHLMPRNIGTIIVE